MAQTIWKKIALISATILLLVSVHQLRLADTSNDLNQPTKLTENYDVIVVGSEPEGIAAAIATARCGQQTLLVTGDPYLGGLLTMGMLNFLDLNRAPEGYSVNTGIFSEFHRSVGGQVVFDVARAKQAFITMTAAESLLTVRLERTALRPLLADDGRRVLGVEAIGPEGLENYLGKILIDATADADFAAASGVPHTLYREDYGVPGSGMAATLMLHFTDVDWAGVRKAASSGKWGFSRSDDTQAWGFGEVAKQYTPKDLGIRLRGLNIARQEDGSVVINAMHIFGVDPLDPTSRETAIERGRRETESVLDWLSRNVSGFERAKIASHPERLYIRESRHIAGLYRLTVHDVLENRMFPDAIAYGSYPIDIQSASPGDPGIVLGNPTLYSVPLGCLIPVGKDNLLVVGRSASFGSLAAGSARVVPLGMSVGQAAGVAAAVAIGHDVGVGRLVEARYYEEVQANLQTQGVRFYQAAYKPAYPDHPATPALKQLVELGLVVGGYENSFPVEGRITEQRFAGLLVGGIKRTSGDIEAAGSTVYPLAHAGTTLTHGRMYQLLRQLPVSLQDQLGLSKLEPPASVDAHTPVSIAEAYRVIVDIINQLRPR